MAASAAASVVWLTPEPIITLTLDLSSSFGMFLTGLTTVFESDFWFVTDAFNCAEACFVAALGTVFTLDAGAGLDAVRASAVSFFFVVGLFKSLAAFAAEPLADPATALTGGLPAFVFGTIGLTGAGAGLVAAALSFFAEDVRVFADFFIAFAMGSTTTCLSFR